MQDLKQLVCQWNPGSFPVYFADSNLTYQLVMDQERQKILQLIERIKLKQNDKWIYYDIKRYQN